MRENNKLKDLMEYDEARLKSSIEKEGRDKWRYGEKMEINQLTQDGWIVEKIVVGGLDNDYQYIWLSRERDEASNKKKFK